MIADAATVDTLEALIGPAIRAGWWVVVGRSNGAWCAGLYGTGDTAATFHSNYHNAPSDAIRAVIAQLPPEAPHA